MPQFAWTDDLTTGNAMIDGDHRRLAGLINALIEVLEGSQANQLMRQAMNDLILFTREHFGHEETEMERIRYVASLAHHSEHAKLLRQIVELKDMLDAGGKINAPAVSIFLREWLRHHILMVDMKLAAALNMAKPTA